MTPEQASVQTRQICALAPVVPVLVVRDAAHARPLARALVAGGLPALEVTLRTPAALAVIGEMAQVPGGVAALKAIGGPLPQIGFCPTGGITPAKAPDYLAFTWLWPMSPVSVAAGWPRTTW